MFIDFAGMMININYIISIYKSNDYSMNKKKCCVNIKYNNYQTTKEFYDTETERNKRFDEIINIINK